MVRVLVGLQIDLSRFQSRTLVYLTFGPRRFADGLPLKVVPIQW